METDANLQKDSGVPSRTGTMFEVDYTESYEAAIPVTRPTYEGHPTKDATYHQRSFFQNVGSADGASSVILDGGLSLALSEKASDRPQSHPDEFAAIGTHFSGSEVRKPSKPVHLDDQIRQKWVESRPDGNGRTFLPIDELEDMIDLENIITELELSECPEVDLVTIAQQVWNPRADKSGQGQTSRQRIFAILCLLQKASQIVSFIDEDIFDHDLPFIFQKAGPTGDVYREIQQDSATVLNPIRAFTSDVWIASVRDMFDKYQWQMLAPCFKFSYGAAEKVLHFNLKDQTIMPFIEDQVMPFIEGEAEDKTQQEFSPTFIREGGFSFVRRVKIHPAHFNPPLPQSSEEIRFAVKELKVCEGSGKRTGEDEALALKRLNNKPHEHLIKLLATYTHRDRYHMIFPWADGNLRMLWQRLSINVAENSRSPQVAKWMSKQVLGLAHALQRIHYCENEERDVQDLPSHDNSKTHGRHGDLKPENILWFKTEATDSMQSFGVLKIADFGFADFHGPHSKSNIRMSAVDGYTETYKAPESDINKLVSPQYDIWSFGCILLQFVVWYLLGWEGVERFSEARMGESKSKAPIPSDKFHQVEIDGERKRLKAYLKSSVTEELNRLKSHPSCSDYILDLLEYIQLKLLKLRPHTRDGIDSIVEEFEKHSEQCEEDEKYGTQRIRPARKIDSDLSVIEEEPDLEKSRSSDSKSSAVYNQSSPQHIGNERDYDIVPGVGREKNSERQATDFSCSGAYMTPSENTFSEQHTENHEANRKREGNYPDHSRTAFLKHQKRNADVVVNSSLKDGAHELQENSPFAKYDRITDGDLISNDISSSKDGHGTKQQPIKSSILPTVDFAHHSVENKNFSTNKTSTDDRQSRSQEQEVEVETVPELARSKSIPKSATAPSSTMPDKNEKVVQESGMKAPERTRKAKFVDKLTRFLYRLIREKPP